MKRLAIVLAICMLLPLNAFALQPLSDDTMGEVTGQAGVSIAVDDIKLYQNIEYLTYTDIEGTGDGFDGSINISNLHMMVNINAITDVDETSGLPFSPGRGVQAGDAYDHVAAGDFDNNALEIEATSDTGFLSKALTIDAGTLAVLSQGASFNHAYPDGTIRVAGVRIGLPTVEVVQTALSFDVTVTSEQLTADDPATTTIDEATYASVNHGASYGRISIGQNTLVVLDGFVEIAPH